MCVLRDILKVYLKGGIMKFVDFGKAVMSDAAPLLPGEYQSLLKKKELRGGVAVMAGEYIGAVGWHPVKDTGELLSVYVLPEARRMGAGSLLLESAILQMRGAGLTALSFTYSDSFDRAFLTPFFNNTGFETNVIETPLGVLTLNEIFDALKAVGVDRSEEKGHCVAELHGKEREGVLEALAAMSGQDMSFYNRTWPGTYVVGNDKKIEAAAFLHEEKDGVISVDYLVNNGSQKLLAEFLNMIMNRLKNHYRGDTVVEMLLATPESEKLYGSMFGSPEETYRIASCRQDI